MPLPLIKLPYNAPTRGMNTYEDPDQLEPNECLSLVNAYPGNPPTPIQGSDIQELQNSSDYEWRPPGVAIKKPSGAYVIILWVYDSNSSVYRLLSVPEDTDGTDFTELGVATFGSTPVFSLLNARSYIYAFSSIDWATWGGSAIPDNHKVLEEDGATVRDMIIGVAGKVNAAAEASSGSFNSGEHYRYAFQYVRLDQAAAFTSGATPTGMILSPNQSTNDEPQRYDTHVVPRVIGIHDSTQDEIVSITTSSQKVTLDLSNSHANAIAQGATHLRVCRSLDAGTADAAATATTYFLTYLPIGVGTTSFDDTVTDSALEGQTNQLVTGYTVPPIGGYSEFVKDRIHIFKDGIDYYSEAPGVGGFIDTEAALNKPEAWASLFKPYEYRLDCESIDGQDSTGLARLGNDLYFFKEEKIFALYGGDPTAGAPELISPNIGCSLPYTITKAIIKGMFGNCILFISNEGPMVILEGGRIRAFSEFKIAELWPDKSSELFGDVRSSTEGDRIWIRNNCTAQYLDNTWWVMYTNTDDTHKVFGFHFDPGIETDQRAPMGPFRMKFGTEET